jgi:hypothetical protein
MKIKQKQKTFYFQKMCKNLPLLLNYSCFKIFLEFHLSKSLLVNCKLNNLYILVKSMAFYTLSEVGYFKTFNIFLDT